MMNFKVSTFPLETQFVQDSADDYSMVVHIHVPHTASYLHKSNYIDIAQGERYFQFSPDNGPCTMLLVKP